VSEMSISENYEGEITPIRSNISRFSRGTVSSYFHHFAFFIDADLANGAKRDV
jgi:hypothetical protein